MNIILESNSCNDITLSSVCDIHDLLKEVNEYKIKNKKNEEIIKFLVSELKRIVEYKRPKDIEKYRKSIKFYILEDKGLHDEAMKLKIEFYSRGGKFPFLPMVNLFSFFNNN